MTNTLKDSYKIGVVSCEDLAKWGKEEGTYEIIKTQFEKVDLKVEGTGDQFWPKIDWIPIYPISGDLPGESELKSFDGFVMSGSHYSVNDDEDWIIRYQQWIKKIKSFQENNLNPPRMVGICFSHQIICKALGGKVGRNPCQKFIWKAEEIKIDETAKDHLFFKNTSFNGKQIVKILESHGESVLVLPEEAKTLASSSSCQYEIVSIGDHILTMQCHPEMPIAPMIDLILPSIKSKRLISADEEELGLQSFQDDLDGDLFLRMIKSYLIKFPV